MPKFDIIDFPCQGSMKHFPAESCGLRFAEIQKRTDLFDIPFPTDMQRDFTPQFIECFEVVLFLSLVYSVQKRPFEIMKQ